MQAFIHRETTIHGGIRALDKNSYIMRVKYKKLEIETADELVFGTAPYPMTTSRGLVIGGGREKILLEEYGF